MSFKCLVISVLIMLCLSHPIFCQEVITSFEETSATTIRNKFSIGVDKLPWDRDKIFSLRLWRNNNKGNEFSIGSIQFKKGKEDEASIINVNFSNIRYVLLYRKKNNRIEGLFITRGIGLSTSFNYSKDKRTNSEYKTISTNMNLMVPIGFEHFFLSKFPNIGYSLEADIFGGFNYKYRYSRYNSETRENKESRFKFGINPRFYFRFYF